LPTSGSPKRSTRHTKTAPALAAIIAFVATLTVTSPAGAQLGPPWDGNPISAGLGPTYGEAWCADAVPGSNIANQQDKPLALIPVEAIQCTLDRFLAEAEVAGIPPRMSYEVIGRSVGGGDLFGVVVNAPETTAQQQASANWFALREIMLTDPSLGQEWLAAWGDEIKIPIFIEANIHGNEEEGTEAIMQVIRDLVTTPYGANPVVDDLLDHAILVVIPSQNPDGRFRGTRANVNGFDMNRDLLVQSQPEIRANVAFQQRWLAPVGLAMHGYVSPTLIDGLTKPHNPGVEYDLFLEWNQPRLDVNEDALADVGMNITRPVNQWNADARKAPPPVGPAYAEGWDDWGPFYTQTYMEFFGVDSSTLEMCNSGPGCKGRFGSKRAQYVGFYSSATFWVDHRTDILPDQLEIFRRGVTSAARPNCCSNPFIAALGFTEEEHNWMVPYPRAFVIPFDGGVQRSDAEANRMVQWLLHNGIQVERADAPFDWNGETFPEGTYVVWMDQALRGLAYTTLSAGQDISERITQLYAPPGAWSHGLLWGADVLEIPNDPAFAPATAPIFNPNPLAGGVIAGEADAYATTLRGVGEVRAILELLGSGVDGEVAEEPFTSESAGQMPAGSLLFEADDAASLAAAGLASGVFLRAGPGGERSGRDHPAGRGAQGGRARRRDRQERHAVVPGADLRHRRRDRHDELDPGLWDGPARGFRRDLQRGTGLSVRTAERPGTGSIERVLRPRGRVHRDQPVGEQLRVPERLGPPHVAARAGLGRGRRRDRDVVERRGRGAADRRLPRAGLPVPPLEHHVLLRSAYGGFGRREVPGQPGRSVPGRVVEGSRRRGRERPHDRPRDDDRREPIPRTRDEPVLSGRRRARVGPDRPGGALVEPHRRLSPVR
jgi:hypothetical protein